MREIDAHFDNYEHMKHLPREAEALHTLRKVASMVKPIMRKRGWKVRTLCEFLPQERNLLGLNINQTERICIRLRYAVDPKQFLSIESVVDTLLHELSHIVHGPHDQKFHRLWDELRSEHQSLLLKGYTGEGFLSAGRKLGGRRIPLDEMRRQARAAAEKRAILHKGSGQRLGGAPVPPRGIDMRQIIADAASRRGGITQGCASGTKEAGQLAEEAKRDGFRTKAEEDDANDLAIANALIELMEEEEERKIEIKSKPEPPTGPNRPLSRLVQEAESRKKQHLKPSPFNVSHTSSSRDVWSCPTCTLENPWTYLCCDACESEKPASGEASTASVPRETSAGKKRMKLRDEPIGWSCRQCGAFMEREWWTCSACGVMKTES
ncbi:WLM-domain-containing protein [Patellaria atrata CBS 101060]|uniref:WLM-domain-containing protein n=1 Tax=Patellaria atrata CBS 101060 TaxID=1346257 RepID=A0A9P4S515_9PEZI|nr:WLM-domain-containing protein [Patellaria atrata CBS 101060]